MVCVSFISNHTRLIWVFFFFIMKEKCEIIVIFKKLFTTMLNLFNIKSQSIHPNNVRIILTYLYEVFLEEKGFVHLST